MRRFHPNSVAVARYGALIRAKSPTNCDAHLAESIFQTRSRLRYARLFCVAKADAWDGQCVADNVKKRDFTPSSIAGSINKLAHAGLRQCLWNLRYTHKIPLFD
ncbi:MAG: DUF6783 domain-containing protein [Blautia faecis]